MGFEGSGRYLQTMRCGSAPNKRLFDLIVCIAFVMLGSLAWGQPVPQHPNQTDRAGKKQGKWTYLLDKNDEPTLNKDSARYYRVIEYKDNVPVGLTRDYYFPSGVLQFEGKLISERPTLFDTLPAPKFFYENGTTNRMFEATAMFYALYNFQQIKRALPYLQEVVVLSKKKEDGSADHLKALENLGYLSFSVGQYDDAERAFLELRNHFGEIEGRLGKRYLMATYNLARTQHFQSKTQPAEKAYREARTGWRVAYSYQDENYYDLCHDLASILRYKPDGIAEADALFRETMAGKLATHGRDSEQYLYLIKDFTTFITDHAPIDSSLKYMELQATLLKARYGENNLDEYVPICLRLAQAYNNTKDKQKSIQYYELIKKIYESKTNPDDAGYIQIIRELYTIYYEIGNCPQAIPLIEILRKSYKKQGDSGYSNYVIAGNNLALCLQDVGEYGKALVLLTETKAIRTKTRADNPAAYAESCNNLAVLYFQMGNFVEAEQNLLETKKIFEDQKLNQTVEYGILCSTLGTVYKNVGNYIAAEKYQLQAIEIIKNAGGTDNENYASVCNNLGGLYESQQQLDKAQHWLEATVRLYSKLHNKQGKYYATSMFNLGVIYQSQKKIASAEKLFLESLKAFEASGLSTTTEYAMACNNLSSLYNEIMAFDKAEKFIVKAAAIQEKLWGKNHPEYTRSILNEAIMFANQGNSSKANKLFTEALAKHLKFIQKDFMLLSENERNMFYSHNKYFFDNYSSFVGRFYKADSLLAGNLFDLQLITKGFLLQSSQKTRQQIMASNNEALKKKYDFLMQQRELLVRARQLPQEQRNSLGISIDQIEEKINQQEKELYGLAAQQDIKGLNKKPYSWKNVRAQLADDEYAIEIIRTTGWPATDTIYLALILHNKANRPTLVKLKNGNQLEKRYLRYYRNSIKSQTEDRQSYQVFWASIMEHLPKAKRAYLSLDGAYHQISLPTLWNAASKKFLMDELDVRIVGSTRDIIEPPVIRRSNKFALFGFPDYRANTQTATEPFSQDYTRAATSIFSAVSQGAINMLPGTETEVKSIAEVLSSSMIPVEMFLKKEATEVEVKRTVNPKVLHIATHGFYLPDSWVKEDVVGSQLSMLRSGLLLAGCEKTFRGVLSANDPDDGILTAYEAMNLSLDETELVVLSACETGLGDIQNGEGVFGLQRAFQQAGSKAVIMSLWKVDDQPTQMLMTALYKNWFATNNLSQAFLLARQEVREKYPHPYFWGGFVLSGN